MWCHFGHIVGTLDQGVGSTEPERVPPGLARLGHMSACIRHPALPSLGALTERRFAQCLEDPPANASWWRQKIRGQTTTTPETCAMGSKFCRCPPKAASAQDNIVQIPTLSAHVRAKLWRIGVRAGHGQHPSPMSCRDPRELPQRIPQTSIQRFGVNSWGLFLVTDRVEYCQVCVCVCVKTCRHSKESVSKNRRLSVEVVSNQCRSSVDVVSN